MSKIYKVTPLYGDNPHPIHIKVQEDPFDHDKSLLTCIESGHHDTFRTSVINYWLETGEDDYGNKSKIEEVKHPDMIKYNACRVIWE